MYNGNQHLFAEVCCVCLCQERVAFRGLRLPLLWDKGVSCMYMMRLVTKRNIDGPLIKKQRFFFYILYERAFIKLR